MESVRKSVRTKVNVRNARVREFLAELIGTAFLVLVGDAAVAQYFLTKSDQSRHVFLAVNWAFGLAAAFAVFICGAVSGGHINPAISISQFLLGNINAIQLVLYIIAQLIGAFIGAFFVWLVYFDAIRDYNISPKLILDTSACPLQSAGIFATYPGAHLSLVNGLVDQIVATAVLSLCVVALTDKRNAEVPKHFVPWMVGMLIAMIGMAFAHNCGYAINPARDFSPRLFTWIAGYGFEVFTCKAYSWVPVVGPIIGAILGAWLYKLVIGLHWGYYEELELHAPKGGTVIKEVTTETVYLKKAGPTDDTRM